MKVLTSLLKEVYIHLGVKVDYGHVVEEKKFLSYHVSFSSISSECCSLSSQLTFVALRMQAARSWRRK